MSMPMRETRSSIIACGEGAIARHSTLQLSTANAFSLRNLLFQSHLKYSRTRSSKISHPTNKLSGTISLRRSQGFISTTSQRSMEPKDMRKLYVSARRVCWHGVRSQDVSAPPSVKGLCIQHYSLLRAKCCHGSAGSLEGGYNERVDRDQAPEVEKLDSIRGPSDLGIQQ